MSYNKKSIKIKYLMMNTTKTILAVAAIQTIAEATRLDTLMNERLHNLMHDHPNALMGEM